VFIFNSVQSIVNESLSANQPVKLYVNVLLFSQSSVDDKVHTNVPVDTFSSTVVHDKVNHVGHVFLLFTVIIKIFSKVSPLLSVVFTLTEYVLFHTVSQLSSGFS
jgi:hypothetical protein